MNLNKTLRKTTELGIGLSAIAALLLVGCGGGGSSATNTGVSVNTGGTTTTTCSATSLTGGNFNAINGNFGTVTLTGSGATLAGKTSFATQSLSYLKDPLAKMFNWGNLAAVSGVIPTINATTLELVTASGVAPFVSLSAISGVTAYGWSGNLGTGASNVSGTVTIDSAAHKVTFTNTGLPGLTSGSAVGTTVTMNGSLCLP